MLPRDLEDRYQVEGRIAVGGSAVILAATDRSSGAPVVLKIFLPEGSELEDAWHREMRLALRLSHPRIIPCLNLTYNGRDHPAVLVFDRALGGSLRRHLVERGSLEEPEVSALLLDVGEALAHAHALGIAHLDVKPENILAHEGRWFLTDFGAGCHLGESAGPPQRMGSVGYTAPEARDMTRLESDQFALGVVGFEALHGFIPTEKERQDLWLQFHRECGLQGVLARLLAIHPARRLASLGALAAVLESTPDELVNVPTHGTVGRWGARIQSFGSRTLNLSDPGISGLAQVPGDDLVVAGSRRLMVIDRQALKTVYASDQPFTVAAVSSYFRMALVRTEDQLRLVRFGQGDPLRVWEHDTLPKTAALAFRTERDLIGFDDASGLSAHLDFAELRWRRVEGYGRPVEVRVNGPQANLLFQHEKGCAVFDGDDFRLFESPPDAVWDGEVVSQ